MKNFCKNIIFHCIDFRLIKETDEFIQSNYGKCDIISIAGSSLKTIRQLENIY